MSDYESREGAERTTSVAEDEDRSSSVPPDEQTALGTSDDRSSGRPETGETTPRPAVDDERVTRSADDQLTSDEGTSDGALLPADQNDRFKSRWEEIQAGFVDEPQKAVEDADALVADLAQRVTASLTKERERLEGQ